MMPSWISVGLKSDASRRGHFSAVLQYHHQYLTSVYLLAAVCSTVLCPPARANPVPEVEDATLRVSELPFSQKLRNPCSLVDASRLQRGTIAQGDKVTTQRTVVNEMKAKSMLIRDSAETILRTNVLQDCTSLDLPAVAVIPTNEDLVNNRPLEVLRLFYTSLLNHTAHVYFISDQLQRHGKDTTCHSPELSTSAKSLASHMRELMCVLRLTTLTLEDQDEEDETFADSTEQILSEHLIDQPLCSRRSVRDCQTVGSTVTLLQQLSSYLQKTVLVGEPLETTTC